MPEPDITPQTIIRAVRELKERRGEWPTRDEIADYLECEIAVVKELLSELRKRRILRDRRRRNETRWMPWSEF